jgi:hypothetical protein
VIRKGGFGYLPQDPRIAGVFDGRTAVTHVLSGRGIDEQVERIEKLRIAMEERPDERNVARYTRAEEEFRVQGGYSAESEARASRPGSGSARSASTCPRGAVGRRAPPGRARPHPLRRQRRALPRRAHEPPRRRRQEWLMGSCASTAGRCS